MEVRWISVLYCMHLASLVVAVGVCAWRFDTAGTMLLCASAWFLILGRASDLGAPSDPEAGGPETLARDLEKATATRVCFERRQAMLNELLAYPGLTRRCDALHELLLMSWRLNADDPDVDHAIHDLRERLLQSETHV